MIFSVLILLLMKLRFDGDMSVDLWLKLMACALVEVIVYFIALKRLDKWDLETNYGRNRK